MLQDLLSSRDALHSLCVNLTSESALRNPAADRWSITQIVDHLTISERRFVIGIKRCISQPPASPELLLQTREIQPILDNHIAVPTRKAQAPETVRPESSSWPEALEAFISQREKTIALFEIASPALHTHVLAHPLLGPMTVAQWFQFTIGHTRRHCLQIQANLVTQ
jgi:hypothetical protein